MTFEKEECAVCLEDIENEKDILECGHRIHLSCVARMYENRCPLCRITLIRLPENIKKQIEERRDKEGALNEILNLIPIADIILIDYVHTLNIEQCIKNRILSLIFSCVHIKNVLQFSSNLTLETKEMYCEHAKKYLRNIIDIIEKYKDNIPEYPEISAVIYIFIKSIKGE